MRAGKALVFGRMKLFLAFLVWIIMGVIIGMGMLSAVAKGSFWLLILALLGFIVLVAKIGCLSHD